MLGSAKALRRTTRIFTKLDGSGQGPKGSRWRLWAIIVDAMNGHRSSVGSIHIIMEYNQWYIYIIYIYYIIYIICILYFFKYGTYTYVYNYRWYTGHKPSAYWITGLRFSGGTEQPLVAASAARKMAGWRKPL
jgi:hypothetical protein